MDWSELQPELIDSISKKLKIHKDYIRFRSVCSNWRTSTSKTPNHLPAQLPWLMLPHSHSHSQSQSQSSNQPHLQPFFSLSDDKTYRLNLPEASNLLRRRCGSSHGWLIILEETPAVFAINPLTRLKHHLPPLSAFPNVINFNFYDVGREYTLRKSQGGGVYTCNLKEMRDTFVKKVVFSSSPSDDNMDYYYAVVILNQTGDLAYCKKGDGVWKFIDDAQSYCEDVVYHKGFFYAVSKYGTIAVCDICCGGLPNVSFIQTPPQVGGDMQYLVSLGDELLLVTRYLELGYNVDQRQLDIFYKTTKFRVYKLVLNGSVWESVGKLDEWALFVGENSSMAFRVCDFEGCKGNRIYFTDDYSEWNYDGVCGEHDVGVYDLDDGSVVALPCYPRKFYNGRRWPHPIWITPSLH